MIAIEYYKKALDIYPKDYVALNNLGLLYESIPDDNLAMEYYKKSIEVKPNYEAFFNLGVVYRKVKEFGNSLKYLKEALKYERNAKVYSAIGASYLIQKNFTEGYKYYSKRYTSDKLRVKLKEIWKGKAAQNQTLRIFCDGGYGDVIMFSRYFEYFKPYFKNVVAHLPLPLIELFKENIKNIDFVQLENTVNNDYDVLLMNLPYYLNMDFTNIPYVEGWLNANKEKTEFFKDKYFRTKKLKVGINRSGQNRDSRNFKHRSIDFDVISKIFDNENIEFYNFCKNDIENNKNFHNVTDVTCDIKDFSDTAALMKNLDLMISIDSSPIHLAGALGVKSFLLLPGCSEWRWFKDNDISSWYKSVKLFRQEIPYSWEEPINKIITELKQN